MTTYSKLHEATQKAHQAAIANNTLEEYWNQLGDNAHAIDEGLLTLEEGAAILNGDTLILAA